MCQLILVIVTDAEYKSCGTSSISTLDELMNRYVETEFALKIALPTIVQVSLKNNLLWVDD